MCLRHLLYVSSTASREFIILKGCLSLHVFVCLCECELFTVMFCFVCLPSIVESHLQQQPPPSAVTVMTSPMQATIPYSSATVPSQTQTSYDPQLAQMSTNSDQLLAQTQTSSSPLYAPVQSSSCPLVVQAQASPLPDQAQGSLGMHPAEDQVSFVTLAAQTHSNSGLFVAQDHTSSGVLPTPMPVTYSMQAAAMLGSSTGEQPLQTMARYLHPVPKEQQMTTVHFGSICILKYHGSSEREFTRNRFCCKSGNFHIANLS